MIFSCNSTPCYIPNCFKMNFDEYSSPLPHLPFSTDYFSKLIFGQAAEIQYPTIAPPGSVTSQNFSTEEPHGAVATLVSPLDIIPSIDVPVLMTSWPLLQPWRRPMRRVLDLFLWNFAWVEIPTVTVITLQRYSCLYSSIRFTA